MQRPKMIVTVMTQSVTGKAVAMISLTRRPFSIEVPRSPLRRARTYSMNCVTGSTSSLSWRLRRSIAAGSASGPSRARTGSPGASLIRQNAINITQKETAAARRMRWARLPRTRRVADLEWTFASMGNVDRLRRIQVRLMEYPDKRPARHRAGHRRQ